MKPYARFLLALWLIGAGSMGSPVPCVAADTPVMLHAANEVRRGVVRLSDLFDGVPAATDRDIAQAPPSGKQAVYDANVLTKLAAKYGLDWHAESAADQVVITSLYTRITEDDIRKAITQKVKDDGVRGEPEVVFDSRVVEVALPADQTPNFSLVNFDYDQLSKRFHADVTTQVGQSPYTLPLTGHISIKLHVPVFAHRIEGGTIIGNADINWINVPEERISDATITDASQLVGRELRRNTSEGELLHTNDVMPPRLVIRGNLITMKIETPMMMLTAQGKALQDGTQGETVRVLNTQSNRMVEGTVDGPGTVTIHTAQKLAAITQ